jgi:hypothetical protein
MTALGKMLVFLVLVLSLVWNGLVVNAYVTRTNWKNEATFYQGEATRAADSANKMKALLEAQREAAKSEKLALEAGNVRLAKQVGDYQTSLGNLNKTYGDFFTKTTELSNKTTQFEANVSKLLTQVNDQSAQIGQREKEIDTLTIEAGKNKLAAERAQLDAAAQQQRADTLAQRLQNLTDELEELKRRGVGGGGGPPARPGERVPPAPERFSGTVQSRDVIGDAVYVTLTPGLDAGLQKGARLTVYRLKPAKYLGKLVITQANPKEAIGRFEVRPGIRPTPEDYPVPGDELKPE